MPGAIQTSEGVTRTHALPNSHYDGYASAQLLRALNFITCRPLVGILTSRHSMLLASEYGEFCLREGGPFKLLTGLMTR